MIQRRSLLRNRAKTFSQYDRLDYIKLFFLFAGLIITVRLFILQIVQHRYYDALASDSHDIFEEIFPERGDILVHDRFSSTGTVPIATNKALYEIHAEPKNILKHKNDTTAMAEALAPLLTLPKDEVLAKLNKVNDPDEILKRRVPEEVMQAVEDLNFTGVYSKEEQWRYYPEAAFAAHITGYFGYSDEDRIGRYGLEGFFNKELAGIPGYLTGEKDALGRFLTIGNSFIQPAVDGDDLVLTIDKNVQYNACSKLNQEAERLSAKEGTLIIMQPHTGAVIAMCNYPSFDPNNYNEVESIDVFTNSAVSDEYEPGSVFKAVTMAAGLDSGAVTPNTTYNDTGEVNIAGFKIKNFDGRAYGVNNMTQVLQNSLNLGTIFVVQQTGNQTFLDYVESFGFSDSTGIELANERSGNITSLENLKDVYAYTGSFGHGFAITPIQLISAYAAIANGGNLMKPYIVDKKILHSGAEVPTQPTLVRRVISADTSRTLSAMLVSVIDSGHAKRAGVPGYYMAGKTGTALIVKPNGQYDASKHNDTFVGFGPISNPEFVMLIKMNEPSSQYAEGSVVPLWGEIAKDLMTYYKIPPDRK